MVTMTAGFAWPDLHRPVIKATDGEEYISGQLVLQLSQSLRGQVNLARQDGIALFGVPALDELNRRLRVEDVSRLMRNPHPTANDMKFGCDMQYVVQFDVANDVRAAAAAYLTLPEIQFACPNGVMRLDEAPNDSSYISQWHLPKIHAPQAWTLAKGDTSVLNCVVDDGGDWLHPDLADNMWVNHPEDINGNGRFDSLPAPDGDLDGVDQDGNGYTDDVIGFDFVDGEPNPMPVAPDNHGSHCWGNVNAVTNNGIGVAGVTWNNRSVNVRCGGGGFVNIAAAISAIYYGLMENVWAYSMSFGSPSRYEPMATACLDAWNSGCVLFGSAGNDGQEARRYPACYDGVENVAASGRADTKASWSNYGTWVDITAPGENIYSTLTRATGMYGAMDGTSMSCPMAAGVATWVKCWFRSGSNQTIVEMIHDGCDSMPDPLFTEGKLGAGRVNMANIIMPYFYCDLKLSGFRFNDAAGNNNGRPDPGEVASLIVTYTNTANWQNAAGISATLACAQPQVEITKSTATFPDIPAGSSGNCSADSFVVSVPGGVPPQNLTFLLAVRAAPEAAFPDTSFKVQSGDPRVLIVDDDNGSDYEKFYTAACDSNGVLYHTYSVLAGGSPSADTLKHYPVVFWFTGNDTASTITDPDIDALTDFLNTGHNLFLSSQNVAQDLSGNAFLADYLHAQMLDDSTGKPYLVGMEGDPITQEDTIVLAGAGGANNGNSLDGIGALAGASGCAFFRDYGSVTTYAAIRYSGTYRLVYFSVPFEAVDHSVSRYLQKWTLVKRILEYFGERVPGVEQPIPVAPVKQPYALRITPNPFARDAQVSFIAPVSGNVTLNTYTTDGRLVGAQTRFVAFGKDASFRLDGAKLSNGVYLIQLVTPEGVYAQKTAVLK
jgi:hypothetical protein